MGHIFKKDLKKKKKQKKKQGFFYVSAKKALIVEINRKAKRGNLKLK